MIYMYEDVVMNVLLTRRFDSVHSNIYIYISIYIYIYMFVNITVSLIETVYMLHFYLAGKTLSYNQLKSCERKMEKEKG